MVRSVYKKTVPPFMPAKYGTTINSRAQAGRLHSCSDDAGSAELFQDLFNYHFEPFEESYN